jgi:hypothetical protein
MSLGLGASAASPVDISLTVSPVKNAGKIIGA